MPIELSNAPAVFQELMNIFFQRQEWSAIAYLGDILIFSETPEDLLNQVQYVYNCLRTYGPKLTLKKCSFFKKQTEHPGFNINEHGVTLDFTKIADPLIDLSRKYARFK